MKILFLAHRIPYPLKDGGVIAMHTILKGLYRAGAQLKLLVLNPEKDNVNTAEIPAYFYTDYNLEFINIDTDIKPLEALTNLVFSRKSYNMTRFYDEQFSKTLAQLLQSEKYDLVHCEGLFITVYLKEIRQWFKGPVTLRAHNVEHRIWEKLWKNEKGALRKEYLRILFERLRKYELETVSKMDALVCLTAEDAAFFVEHGFEKEIHISAHGIDFEKFASPAPMPENLHVFHLGSMDWLPNQEAMNWFLDKVWPLVIKEKPEALFYLAGKKIPPEFYQRNMPSLVIAGEVPDARAFMEAHYLMVVPLLSGSGIRVKILEGMALEKPVIATDIAAEGIECKDGSDILIAKQPENIARYILDCLDDREKAYQLGRHARQLIERKYNNDVISAELYRFYNGLV